MPLIARLAVALAVAFVLFACASIDAPASFTAPDASSEPLVDAGAARRCGRILPRRFVTDAVARVYGAKAGAQAVCVSVTLAVPNTSPNEGVVTFCVAGRDLATASVGRPHDIDLSSTSCAYCVDVQTSCTPDGGIESCRTVYAPIAGSVRIVRLGRSAGEDVWVDLGALVVARLDDPDGGVEPRDCLFADALTFQGKLVAATCTDDSFECRIANSASSRFP